MSVEDRLKQLQEAHRDFGPASQHFLSSKFFELIDAWGIWWLSQKLTVLCSRFFFGLRKFLFHVAIYFPGFVELFHLYNSTNVLTGVLPLGFTAIHFWAMVVPLVALFFVLSFLQRLMWHCSRIFVFITTFSHFLKTFAFLTSHILKIFVFITTPSRLLLTSFLSFLLLSPLLGRH